MSQIAVIDTALAALAAPTPSTDNLKADFRVDDFGRLWVRPSSPLPGVEAVASTAHTTSANTAAITIPDGVSKINIFIDITAVGGDSNETLDVAVEWSPDTGTTWFVTDGTADTFNQMTQPEGTQAVAKQFNVLAPTYRLALTLAGTTPAFTLTVDHVGVYA